MAHYNQYPTMQPQPQHILDEKLENVSFAFSHRNLVSDYNGPLIRLRRVSDNVELDFYADGAGIVDLAAINNWRSGANVYVTVWYDQSGLNHHAIQANITQQPQFIPDPTLPHLVGDGSNDILLVQEDFQNLTENGKNGSVLGVFFATDRAGIAFGVNTASERWLTHINWSNKQCYFDPGYCCNNPRSFFNYPPTHATNPGSLTKWDQYSFVRRNDLSNSTTDRTIMRLGGIEKVNGGLPDNQSCNLTYNFGICAASSSISGSPSVSSNTKFVEIIMYKTGLSDTELEEIEQNQIGFWNL